MASGAYDVPGLAYGGIVAVGGLMGYIKAGSVPSLVAGVVSGGLIAVGAQRAHNDGKVDLVLAVSAGLLVLMGRRFAASGKFMPAGLVSVLSLAFLVRYALRLAK